MALAMPVTSSGVSRLEVSRPSVRTASARRRPSRCPTRSAACAIASRSDVSPNGMTDAIAAGRVFRPTVNGATSTSCVSKVKIAASSRPSSSQLRMWPAASRVAELGFHAAADVEQQGDAHAGDVAAEVGDRAWFGPVEDLEVARREVLNEAAFVIADHCGDANEVDARFEAGDRRRTCANASAESSTSAAMSMFRISFSRVIGAGGLQSCCHHGNILIYKELLRRARRRCREKRPESRKNYAILAIANFKGM